MCSPAAAGRLLGVDYLGAFGTPLLSLVDPEEQSQQVGCRNGAGACGGGVIVSGQGKGVQAALRCCGWTVVLANCVAKVM